MKLLEDLKLTGRMLGCHQVTAEVLGPEAVRFFRAMCFFFVGHGEFHWLVKLQIFLNYFHPETWGRFPI